MKKILLIGYKESLVKKILNQKSKVICLIDDFDDPDFLPSIRENEERIRVKDTANDFFILTKLLIEGHYTFDAVISPFEFTQFNAAFLAEFYNCPTPGIEVISRFRDKALQKKSLSNKIKYANYSEINNNKLPSEFPIVIKPSSGTGTFQTHKIKDKTEYLKIIDSIEENTNRFTTVLAEQFIEGDEYYVDGWIENYKIQRFSISKYLSPLINIHRGKLLQGITLDTNNYQKFYQKVKRFLEIVLTDLGLNNSFFHLEFFLDFENNIIFGECGSRIGGNMTEANFYYHFNIDLDQVILNLSLGEKNNLNTNKNISKLTGFTVLPTPDNFTHNSRLPQIRELKLKFPEIISVRYDWITGMDIPDHTSSTSDRLGMVLVSGLSEENIKNSLLSIIEYFESFYKEGENAYE